MAESYGPELTPTEAARKHGISSGQLYTWRREMLGLRSGRRDPDGTTVRGGGDWWFGSPRPEPHPGAGHGRGASCLRSVGRMEIVLPGGVAIRVDAEVDGDALRRVLAALGRR